MDGFRLAPAGPRRQEARAARAGPPRRNEDRDREGACSATDSSMARRRDISGRRSAPRSPPGSRRADRCPTRCCPRRAESTEGGAVAETLPAELVDRVRDRVFTEATRGDLSDADTGQVIGELNALAQYGDIPSRWALLRNYHQSAAVRRVVGAGDITRYGLDLVVTRPEQAEKVDFEFIFTALRHVPGRDQRRLRRGVHRCGARRCAAPGSAHARRRDAAGAVRAGGCEAILPRRRRSGSKALGDDGCAEPAQSALIAHAKDAGPAGVEAAIRAAAADMLRAMDVAAN